jgi:lactonase
MARTRSRKSLALGIAALLAVGLVGAATATAATAQGGPPGTADSGVIWAQPYAKVVGVDPPSQLLSGGGTLLEGPSIGANGQLYFVDLTAPGGAPKVLELNLQTKKITPLHTDSTSSLSSLTFSPVDGKAYLTDLSNGDIYSMNPDGSDFTTVLSGPVLGRQSAADDISFDPQGNFYQCLAFDGKILIWNSVGDLLRTVRIPQNLPQSELLSTNLAIKPGTTTAYVTVGGGNGGYIYTFQALAKGIAQSNGGTA